MHYQDCLPYFFHFSWVGGPQGGGHQVFKAHFSQQPPTEYLLPCRQTINQIVIPLILSKHFVSLKVRYGQTRIKCVSVAAALRADQGLYLYSEIFIREIRAQE